MLGPNSTALPGVSCFYVHVPLRLLCPDCRTDQLMSLPTDLPTPFTLLASQVQPGQGLQDRRPWGACWYRVCYSLSSSRSKNAPDIGSDFKCPIPPKEPVVTDVSGYFRQPLCWWLVSLPALDGASDPSRPRLSDPDSTVMSINHLFPSNLHICFLGTEVL